ncbi:MAG: RlmE family RNA methyltransferase [Paracoccaceae bacterium]|nr:RlmE family RNA methyltransferase [Paracoccaceae bacterium]MDE2915012.1 RlmE family RNA methyltransferase [Paracoccaceae bacterium]
MKPGPGGSGRGRRDLHVRVRTAKGRRSSSTRWLERQLNDPYVQRAQAEGYRSRSAYKLIELDDRFRFLSPGVSVIDLGCAPGGWSQVAVERVNAQGRVPGHRRGSVIGIDIQPVEPLSGATFVSQDIFDRLASERNVGLDQGNHLFDVVLSDMAPSSSGDRKTDHLRIVALCEAAAELAFAILSPGGTLVLKVLAGGAESGLQTLLKRNFARVRTAKPPASRPDSSEKFVVATGFRGGHARPEAD